MKDINQVLTKLFYVFYMYSTIYYPYTEVYFYVVQKGMYISC